MAKEKVTVTIDRAKVATARRLIDGSSTSQVLDVALSRLIATEQTRRDVEAYLARPFTGDELTVADLPVEFDLDDDAVDYDDLYG
jgi:hypothetical protein